MQILENKQGIIIACENIEDMMKNLEIYNPQKILDNTFIINEPLAEKKHLCKKGLTKNLKLLNLEKNLSMVLVRIKDGKTEYSDIKIEL